MINFISYSQAKVIKFIPTSTLLLNFRGGRVPFSPHVSLSALVPMTMYLGLKISSSVTTYTFSFRTFRLKHKLQYNQVILFMYVQNLHVLCSVLSAGAFYSLTHQISLLFAQQNWPEFYSSSKSLNNVPAK